MLKLKIAICILISILAIFLTPTIFIALPVLTNLFTDNINYILIMLVIIFIMLIDVYVGTTLALVILYMAMYINNNNTYINSNTTIKQNLMFPMKTLPNSIQILPPNSNMINDKIDLSNIDLSKIDLSKLDLGKLDLGKVDLDKLKLVKNSISNINNNMNTITDDSEFIYDNTKPFPNKNIKPFQPQDYDSKQNNNTNKQNVNVIQQTINQNDSITQVGEPDRSGFDISGCRYDMKNSPQNLTKYGPPVSQCSAYDSAKAQICGTVFYPLHA
jgi:hypothetical protein